MQTGNKGVAEHLVNSVFELVTILYTPQRKVGSSQSRGRKSLYLAPLCLPGNAWLHMLQNQNISRLTTSVDHQPVYRQTIYPCPFLNPLDHSLAHFRPPRPST